MSTKENKLVSWVFKIGDFLKEVKNEMQKVTWANKQELKESVILILIAVTVLTLVVWVFDIVLSQSIDLIIQ